MGSSLLPAEEVITVGCYATFLQAIQGNELVGESYLSCFSEAESSCDKFTSTREPKVPRNFISCSDAVAYCDWENRLQKKEEHGSNIPFFLPMPLFCRRHVDGIDPELKSNHLIFDLLSQEVQAFEASGVGVFGGLPEEETVIAYVVAAMGLGGVIRGNFQNPREQPEAVALPRSTSEQSLQPRRDITPPLPSTTASLMPPAVAEPKSMNYQKDSAETRSEILPEKTIKRVTFSILEPPAPPAEPLVIYKRADYEQAKQTLLVKVQEFQERILHQPYRDLALEEQTSLLQAVAQCCDDAIQTTKMASRIVHPEQLEPMKREPRIKTRRKIAPLEIEIPFITVEWSVMTQAEKKDLFMLRQVNDAIDNLRNFKKTLLVPEKEAGAVLLESQKERAIRVWRKNISIERAIRELQQPFDKRDMEINKIVDSVERIKERRKVTVCRLAIHPVRKEAHEKTNQSYDLFMSLRASSPIEDPIQAREEAIKESLMLISEALVLADDLANMVERKKRS